MKCLKKRAKEDGLLLKIKDPRLSNLRFCYNFLVMAVKLSKEDFLKSFKYVPRAAISLLIKNSSGEFILSKRSNEPFQGQWYFPGSYILKGELFSECFERIARDELGFELSFSKAKFIGIYENLHDDKRGHTLDIIYQIPVSSDETKKIKSVEETRFFKSIPDNIFPGHKKILNSLEYK